MPIRTVESVKADLATLDAAFDVVSRVMLREMEVTAGSSHVAIPKDGDSIMKVYEFLEGYLEGLRDPFRDAKDLLEKIESGDLEKFFLLHDGLGALLVQYVRFLEGRVAELADKMESYRP